MYEGHIAKARRMGPARYGTSYARYTTRRYKSNPKGLLALVNRQIGRSEEKKESTQYSFEYLFHPVIILGGLLLPFPSVLTPLGLI